MKSQLKSHGVFLMSYGLLSSYPKLETAYSLFQNLNNETRFLFHRILPRHKKLFPMKSYDASSHVTYFSNVNLLAEKDIKFQISFILKESLVLYTVSSPHALENTRDFKVQRF